MQKHPINLKELVDREVISKEIAEEISTYYNNKSASARSGSRILIAFGIIGAILVGLGILLIIAHNWDNMSRSLKTVIGFIPLVLGQLLVAYTMVCKRQSTAWRESSGILLSAAVGVTLSVISQVYNIPGSLSGFLLTWMLLILPLIYLLKSSMCSMFYVMGITYFACESGYFSDTGISPHWYWLLILGVLPHYYLLLKNKPKSNFTLFHHWIIPLSLVCALGILGDDESSFMFPAYLSLLGIYTIIGYSLFQDHGSFIRNGFKVIGVLGTLGLLIFMSFRWMWDEIAKNDLSFISVEFWVWMGLMIIGMFLLARKARYEMMRSIHHYEFLFLLFVVIFGMGMQWPVLGMILTNILILGASLLTIRKGAIKEHLGILNLGLITIAILIACRFFDTDISFIFRGVIFVALGISFFFANYYIIKNRSKHE